MAAPCDVTPALTVTLDAERVKLVKEAFRLEWFTIAWMTVEAVVAIAAGVAAHSISLTAFGIDSLIEIISAGVLVWRLSIELRHGRSFSDEAERTASRIAGGLLFALATYVIIAAGWSLWRHESQAFSWPGLALTLLTMPVMYLLARRKLTVGRRLGSRALRADAIEAITCGWLSFVVVAGLLTQLTFGAWWVDSIISLAIVWFLIKEGREAWTGQSCCEDNERICQLR
jgi:divalent metal cation (Fe/Co/Zn/Cd) transporter